MIPGLLVRLELLVILGLPVPPELLDPLEIPDLLVQPVILEIEGLRALPGPRVSAGVPVGGGRLVKQETLGLPAPPGRLV